VTRRKKTSATPIAEQIRRYAANYAASGQKEYAAGMAQAADIVDELTRKAGGSAPSSETPGRLLEPARQATLAHVMRRLEALESRLDSLAHRKTLRLPRASTDAPKRESALPIVSPSSVSGDDMHAYLAMGEWRTLLALEALRERGASGDELTAITTYKKTSLRTFLGNLRAADFAATRSGRHYVTSAGLEAAATRRSEQGVAASASGWTPLTGPRLLASHLSHLSAGEQKILQYVAECPEPPRPSDIESAVGLKKTSVRKYVGELKRRCLVVRGGGRVALAPILREESAT
jgi:hypothetical protein